MDKEHTNIAVIIALLVVAIFFGGWYLVFGQLYNQSSTDQTATTTQELPIQ